MNLEFSHALTLSNMLEVNECLEELDISKNY